MPTWSAWFFISREKRKTVDYSVLQCVTGPWSVALWTGPSANGPLISMCFSRLATRSEAKRGSLFVALFDGFPVFLLEEKAFSSLQRSSVEKLALFLSHRELFGNHIQVLLLVKWYRLSPRQERSIILIYTYLYNTTSLPKLAVFVLNIS